MEFAQAMISQVISYVNWSVTEFITKMCSIKSYNSLKVLSVNTLKFLKINTSAPVSKLMEVLFISFITLTHLRKL